MSECRYLAGKVTRRSLPIVSDPRAPDVPNLKRLRLAQGDLAQVHNSDDPIRYLAVIEMRPGAVRGNHYHKVKREFIYLIAGEVVLLLEDLATGDRERVTLNAGDLVSIAPGIAHALHPAQPGQAIEFSPDPLDPADSYRHQIE